VLKRVDSGEFYYYKDSQHFFGLSKISSPKAAGHIKIDRQQSRQWREKYSLNVIICIQSDKDTLQRLKYRLTIMLEVLDPAVNMWSSGTGPF